MTRSATGRLPLALGACGAGLLLAVLAGKPGAIVVVAPWFVLLALGLAGTRTRTRPHNLEVSVDDERVVIGDDVAVVATLSADATGRASFTPTVADHLLSATTGLPNELRSQTASVSPGQPTEVTFTTTPQHWGRLDITNLRVELTEPFGLFRWSQDYPLDLRVLIHPTTEQVRSLLPLTRTRFAAGRHRAIEPGRGIEQADVRPFQPGDSPRDINWRISARSTPQLWVSARHPDRGADLVLLLDTFADAADDLAEAVKMGIEACLAVGEAHLSASDRIGIIELGGAVRWVRVGAGRLQLQRLVDALLSTRLYASAAERNLTAVSSHTLPPRAAVLAFTSLADHRFTGALGQLSASGREVSAVICRPHSSPSPPRSATGQLAERLERAEHAAELDRLTERSIAAAEWRTGDPVEIAMAELQLRRAVLARGRR